MLRNFFAREDHGQMEGQTLVEYALIIALVSVTLMGALVVLSGGINTIFSTINGKISTAGQ